MVPCSFALSQDRDAGVGISLSASYHRFFTSTWFQQNFADNYTFVPALGIDVPIGGPVAVNGRFSYVGTSGSMDWGYGRRIGSTKLQVFRLDLLLQWRLHLADQVLLIPELGPFVASVSESRKFYSTYTPAETWSFGMFGAVGGLTTMWSPGGGPFSLFVNVDASYGYRGEESLLREYGGMAGGLGIRFCP